jgi:putative ABC transport system substrate-binding protein
MSKCLCIGTRPANAGVAYRSAVIGLLAIAVLLPLAADAQRSGLPPRIAFLSSDAACAATAGYPAFLEGLRSLGYREGENVSLECRSAEGKYERLDGLAAELIKREPAVLVAAAAPASLASKRATRTIPIVSVYAADPLGLGLVSSLARPDGNITGVSALAADYAAKSLQILKELAPRTTRVGVLGHKANPTYAIYQRELEATERTLALTLDFVGIESSADIEPALATMARRKAEAILVMHQPLMFEQRQNIVAGVARLRLPAMYGSREAVEAGGLVSYAVSVGYTFRRAASLVDKLLHGTKTTDIPFEQPTNFELALNLKAAEALGLKVPTSLRVRADALIE